MAELILITIILFYFSVPIYWIYKLIACIFSKKSKVFHNESFLLNKKWLESVYTFIVLMLCSFGFLFNSFSEKTGVPLEKYDMGQYTNNYTSLSFDHMLTVLVFFVLGVIAYYIIKMSSDKLPPIPYVICCSLLIINILFTFVYLFHTIGISNLAIRFSMESLQVGFTFLSIIYIIELKNSIHKFIEKEKFLNKEYTNKFLNKLYILFIKYETMPILWVISLFPVLIIIQLILVLFGQQPDSFIKVFFETSTYNYSQITPPAPIIIPGNGHYLCTVSVKGHNKIVKPLRSGIRGGNRILVNRQLLIANAFENILEQYTPRFHKMIRYIYDKYGYPLSIHINTPFTADLVYILMKLLEWIFLAVLYCVDVNPENRINIQYSELRK